MSSPRRPRKPLDPASSSRERALDALAVARREGYSLRRASDLARTDPRTVRRYVGSAFVKSGGRWRATHRDRLAREMTLLTPGGPVQVVVRDSRTASAIAAHRVALTAYLEPPFDDSRLKVLKRKRVRVSGEDYELVTDPIRIDRLGKGGELDYDIYVR